MDANIIAALIAAAVSILIWILSIPLEPLKDKLTYTFKLKTEYRYQQKREVKNVISKYKMQLIDSADSLNRRFWNMREHYDWLAVNGHYSVYNHYLYSFVYKILNFHAWIRKIEKDMIYLDIAIAEKHDLEFVKFLKLFKLVLCDAELIHGIDNEYDISFQNDHLFVSRFEDICSLFDDSETVKSFTEFRLMEKRKELYDLYDFLDGANPQEKRYRWDLLQMFHYLIIMFLNSYGYDYQHTDKAKIQKLLSDKSTKNNLNDGLKNRLTEYHMNDQKYVKEFLRYM